MSHVHAPMQAASSNWKPPPGAGVQRHASHAGDASLVVNGGGEGGGGAGGGDDGGARGGKLIVAEATTMSEGLTPSSLAIACPAVCMAA